MVFFRRFLCTCDSNRDSGFYFKTFSIGIKRLASPHHILDLHNSTDVQYQYHFGSSILKKNHAYNCPLFPVDLSPKTSQLRMATREFDASLLPSLLAYLSIPGSRWFKTQIPPDEGSRFHNLEEVHVVMFHMIVLKLTRFPFLHRHGDSVSAPRPYGVLWNPMAWWKSHPTAVPKDAANGLKKTR